MRRSWQIDLPGNVVVVEFKKKLELDDDGATADAREVNMLDTILSTADEILAELKLLDGVVISLSLRTLE